MASKGWICLHRAMTESSWYGKPDFVSLWIHMLFKANHKDKKVVMGNQIIEVKRGQFIAGRKSLAAETGVQESKVNRIINVFKSEQQLEQQAFSKFSLFSIVNYSQYQDIEHQSEQHLNSKRTASEQHLNTNNNDNNVNNGNNVVVARAPSDNDTRERFAMFPEWKPTFSQIALVALRNANVSDQLIQSELPKYIACLIDKEGREHTQHEWTNLFKSSLIKIGLSSKHEKNTGTNGRGFNASTAIASAAIESYDPEDTF